MLHGWGLQIRCDAMKRDGPLVMPTKNTILYSSNFYTKYVLCSNELARKPNRYFGI